MGMISREGKLGIREKVIRYLIKGDVLLHADEERMLERWTFTDSLLRSRKYTRSEIISMITKRYSISKFTADRDITSAHSIFGTSRQLNKKYLLAHHIEEIGLVIQQAKTDPTLKPLLPKLFEAYTKAVYALPEDYLSGESTPTMLQFVLNGDKVETGMTTEQAMEMAKKYMKRKAYAEDADFDILETDVRDDRE